MIGKKAAMSAFVLGFLAGGILLGNYSNASTSENLDKEKSYPIIVGQEKKLYLDGKDKIAVFGERIASVKYSSTKKKVAVINKQGTITPKKKGTTVIKATVVYRKKAGGKKYTRNLKYKLQVLGKTKEYFKVTKKSGSYQISGLTEKAKKQKELYVPGYLGKKKITQLGNNLFANNRKIEIVHLSDNISNLGQRVFYGSDNLEKLCLGKNFSDYGNLDGVFAGCGSLEKVILDSQNKYFKVEDDILFSKDGTKLYLYPAKRMGKEYKLPESVKVLGDSAFADCQELKHVVISDNVTSIQDYCFANSGIVGITIPDSVTTIGKSTFLKCEALQEISLSKNIASIPSNAFSDCVCLNEIMLPEGLKNIASDAFFGCKQLQKINIKAGNANFVAIDGVLYNAGKDTLLQYPKGKADSSYQLAAEVRSIGEYAFEGCSYLEKVVLSDNLRIVRKGAFMNSGIKEITLPDSVIQLEDFGFAGCYSLTNVTLSNSLSTLHSNLFADCINLSKITIPRSVTSTAWVEESFLGCDNLSCIEVDEDNSKFSSIDGILYSKDKTVLYRYPIGKSGEKLVLPKMLKKINGYAFTGTKWLQKVVVSSGIKTISKNAFRSCESLKEISIPSTVTKIEKFAFSNCMKLATIKIGSKIKKIQDQAFAYCENMRSVTITSKKIRKSVFGSQVFYRTGANNYKKLVVKVPKSKKKTYTKIFYKAGLSKKAKVTS